MTQPKAARRAARRKAAPKPALPKWSRAFLAELAATSNVSAAARKADIATATAYDARRSNIEFHRKWQEALCEGYDHLEMELLCRLRTGEVKPAAAAKRGVRAFDNGNAFRLLAAHQASAARQRAIRDNQDSAAVLASLDAKLELMRHRWLAAHKDDGATDGAGDAERDA